MIRAIYLVVWRDAFNDEGDWKEFDSEDSDGMEEVVVQTVGFLGRENDHYLEVVSSLFVGESTYCSPMTIPKGCIISKTKLTQPKG